MKNFSGITDNLDITTKKYVDDGLAEKANSSDLATVAANVNGKLSKTENTGVNVLGTTKSTTTLGGNQLVAPNGIIFAGTAANAGLVTRGICGVTTPDSKGACSKENLYINYDGNNDFNVNRQLVLNAGAVGNHLGSNMYQYTAPRGEIVKNWVEAKGYATSVKVNGNTIASSGGVVDIGNVVTDVSGKANLAGGNTFSGVQTINAPTNVNGSEQTTMKVKTSNDGAIIFGKEGPNSGTMIRLDQADGTCRLRFRSSATAGAMVWEQPESGAQLYVDLGARGGDYHRVEFPSGAGTLALTSQIPTKVSELTNDSGYTKNKGTVTQVKINGTTNSPDSAGLVDLGTISGGSSDNSKHGYTELTNENLNTITEAGWYRAESGNTCTNRPSEISNNSFFLNVEKLNDTHIKQEIYVGLDYVSSYTRDGQSAYSGGTLDWSGWSSNMKISGFAQTFSGRKAFSSGINLINSLQVGGSNGATGQFLMSQGGSTPKWSSIQVKVNGTVYTIDSDGLIDLGTIGGTTTYTSMGNDIY